MKLISIYEKLSKTHNSIEKDILDFIYPNIPLIELRNYIEYQINHSEFKIAFPIGLNLNHCCAHYSPFDNDKQLFTKNDILKIDYGIHHDGYILDSAFTVTYDLQYKKLLDTSRKACIESAKLCKMGTPINQITKSIESNIKKNNFNIIPNLCGHQIKPYQIHSGKVIPNSSFPYFETLSENDIITIEPFVTTSKSPKTFEESKENTHYMFNYHQKKYETYSGLFQMLPSLQSYFTLAFHKEWLPINEQSYLSNLVSKQIINEYPPIYDTNKNAKVAQFETTILITKEGPFITKQFDSIEPYLLNYK